MASIADLDAVKASSKPFEFEYIKPDGTPSGVFLQVLGGQADKVREATAALQNERRQRQAQREVAKRVAGAQRKIEYDKYEEDVEHGKLMAASRLVGWRGLDDEFTPANALLLCQVNADIAAQILEKSDALENFM